ncbi:hypothetical protein I7I53_03889 [Histoplasma capsulatum var. duboisii H88]|uniref:Uncharacterized protein n=1 Tax=Ajellomyces capsulatus (strain H88) TaxID=544711 RepID=A0A8A1LNL8_AJEC8|nr:hypothetical protein I7I53_03889 [Histoplasma capsulatum var. duboisii H88]
MVKNSTPHLSASSQWTRTGHVLGVEKRKESKK